MGPRLVKGARNLGRMSGHGCYCQEGLGPVICSHLLVLGLDPDSRQPCPLETRVVDENCWQKLILV